MSTLPDGVIELDWLAAIENLPPVVATAPEERVENAFTRLYAEHAPRIQRFLRDLLGDGALAADATQETFVRAFRQRETFDRSRETAPWLFGIARNVSLELRRARTRRARIFVGAEDVQGRSGESSSASHCPERNALAKEACSIVALALAKLSEDRRTMLLLRLDHGFSYDEIARVMGCSVAKAKVEVHRAREVLRAVMAAYERGGAT